MNDDISVTLFNLKRTTLRFLIFLVSFIFMYNFLDTIGNLEYSLYNYAELMFLVFINYVLASIGLAWLIKLFFEYIFKVRL